jgi:hypothetical protein
MQLIAGRTAQEFNQRKSRKGAFWEDRYHAVAIDTESHLVRCLVYIDLNMVRAGVVQHPEQWPFSGYNEICWPPKRYGLIDQNVLAEKCGCNHSLGGFRENYRRWVEAVLAGGDIKREPSWSESIVVGSKRFVEKINRKLGRRARGRRICEDGDAYIFREHETSYSTDFDHQKGLLSPENMFEWNVYFE